MVSIHVGTDRIGSSSHDLANLNSFINKLKAAGHTVVSAGRGDNAIQGHMTRASNKCDIMVQIAGGLCPGTFLDFNWGTRGGKNCNPGYYHADKFCIPIETSVWTNYAKYNPKTYKLPASAWDDSFSQGKLDKSKVVGRTWQEISTDKTNFARCVGFVEGKSGDELATGFLKLLNGGSSTSSTDGSGAGGGSSALDLIKQVCSDWDPLGPEIQLNGDTVTVKRTDPKSAVALGTNRIQMNSVSFTDYDSNTPNSFSGAKDQYLINRFGEVPLELDTTDSNKAQILQVNQRGHNHVIELKALLNKDYIVGNWVNLTIPELELDKRPYYISKSGYSDERLWTLTLESAPPSIFVEVPEEVEEESEDTEETDDGDD